jgi:hypothetical protein
MGATALRRLVAIGSAGFVDALVKPGCRELCRTCGSLPRTVFSVVAVLARGDDSVVVSAVVTGLVARSGFAVCGSRAGGLRRANGVVGCGTAPGAPAVAAEPTCRPGEPSELESPPEGDGPSARAIPLANPTVTQTESSNAASVNPNHQQEDDLPVFSSHMRFVNDRTPLARSTCTVTS